MDIRYSDITKKMLEQYYKDNFLDTGSSKEYKRERVVRYIYAVISVGVGLWWLDFLIQKFPVEGVWLDFLIQNITVDRLIPAFGVVSYIICVCFVMRHLFPVYGRTIKEAYIKEYINGNLGEIFDFQEVMKKNKVEKVTTDGFSSLTIEYKAENGITKTRKLSLTGYYEKTVKDQYIDFQWTDGLINQLLADSKYALIDIQR